jgi:hypothetical protein
MFHQQAGFIKSLPKNQEIADFDFLTGIAPRIRNVVLLGGEPFYDPACKNFLRWAQKNLQAQLTLFTNGSQIDWEFIDSYTGSMTIVFSLDAVGSPAEYIRFGTKWPVVENNYKKMLSRNGVETRVNVTTSIFNYLYLPALLQMLGQNRPKIITWGYASKPHFTAAAVADKSTIITSIDQALDLIPAMGLDTGQFHHANNALTGLKHNIQETPFQLEVSDKLRDFIRQMDRIKHINLRDHCPELASLLEIS